MIIGRGRIEQRPMTSLIREGMVRCRVSENEAGRFAQERRLIVAKAMWGRSGIGTVAVVVWFAIARQGRQRSVTSRECLLVIVIIVAVGAIGVLHQ